MTLYSDAPELREFRHDKPTLLVCWWATSFCALMIILRVIGRFIRTEKLFLEDKIAALALIPLILRMVCVHFVLIYGTNNADFDGVDLSPLELHRKSVASGLVLASRILYAATLWILKNTILEFLKRLTGLTWERSHQYTLIAIRWTLVATFIAVVISNFVECRPFAQYWQVVPDPGGQCRQGYAQLITMATCNVLTDIMLVVFPIPIIVQSQMNVRRKIQLVLLFSLSLSVVGVTLYRVPHVIDEHGGQQYRSLLASVELLFATASANALVLGSFVRDRGVKKQKFRRTSGTESFDRASSNPRRPTLHRQWGSDEDLVRDVGLSVDPELRLQSESSRTEHFTAAPIANHVSHENSQWNFPKRQRSNAEHSDDSLLPYNHNSNVDTQISPKKLSLFDVGGLLEGSVGGSSASYRRGSYTSSTVDPHSPHSMPPASLTASSGGARRGSTALLQDLGGLLGPLNTRSSRTKHKNGTELQPIPQSRQEHPAGVRTRTDPVLVDAGGLLQRPSRSS